MADKEKEEAETSGESKPENEETEKEIEKDLPAGEAGEKADEEAVEDTAKDKEEKKEEEEANPPAGGEEPKAEAPKEKPKKDLNVSGKLKDIIKDIESLSVLELADLVKALEEKFGVAASAPMAVAGPSAPAGAGEDTDAEEQTTFNVILTEAGTNKIGAIKAVREIVPTLGLKEAKDLVDSAPKPVLEGAGKDAANEAKGKLEAAGAKVELQ